MGAEESEDGSSYALSVHFCLLEWMTKQTMATAAAVSRVLTIQEMDPVGIKKIVGLGWSMSKKK
jgi:hypothetical protein